MAFRQIINDVPIVDNNNATMILLRFDLKYFGCHNNDSSTSFYKGKLLVFCDHPFI